MVIMKVLKKFNHIIFLMLFIDPGRPPSQPKPSMAAPFTALRAPSTLKQHFGAVDLGEPTRSRAKPRRPDFLMESLQREGLWKSISSSAQDRHG